MSKKKVPAKQKIELERLDLAQRRSRRYDRGQVSEKLTYKHDKSSFTGKLGSENLITTKVTDSNIHTLYLTPDCYIIIASLKENNPNVFRYDETMNGKHRSQWIKSAIKEIADLEQFDYLVEVRIKLLLP